MKCLFVVTENMTELQIENSYLLCLAMLNFDHHVNVVFTGKAFKLIQNNSYSIKQWLALKLYGIEHMYQLNQQSMTVISEHLETINHTQFECLKTQSDHLS